LAIVNVWALLRPVRTDRKLATRLLLRWLHTAAQFHAQLRGVLLVFCSSLYPSGNRTSKSPLETNCAFEGGGGDGCSLLSLRPIHWSGKLTSR